MAEPRFEIGQEIHIAQHHCEFCKELEEQLEHPIMIKAITPFAHGFAYRIEDVNGTYYETREECLCSHATGHRSSPCEFCGQQAA